MTPPERRAEQMGGGVAEKSAEQHTNHEQVAARELAKKGPVGKRHTDPHNPEHRVGDLARCLGPGPGERERRRQRGDDHEEHRRRAVVERREGKEQDRDDSRDSRRPDAAEQTVQLPCRGRAEQRQAHRQEHAALEHQRDRQSGGRDGHRHARAEIGERVRSGPGIAPFPRVPSGVVEPELSRRAGVADPGPRRAVGGSFA